jgi:hypothetical protein
MALHGTHRRSLIPALLALLAALAQSALAATAGFTVLPTAATDNQTYATRFAVGLTVDGGKSWQTSANLNQQVLIKASIDPAPAHVGVKADIFVVERYNNTFTMRTPSGVWVPWSTKIADLQPAYEDLTLAATQEITLYSGGIATAGEHRMYVGYMLANGTALIYTPTAGSFQFNAAATDPLTYFQNEIFDSIVMTKCTLCHVDGGAAAISDLRFLRDATKVQQNFDIFSTFYKQQTNAFDYVLTKVSGGGGHVGGIQLALGSSDYQKMAAFLGLLDGNTTVSVGNSSALLDGTSFQTNAETLRDAALLLAGRLPTSTETTAVAAGDAASLRTTVLGLMQGAHFHKFLKDAANDRLFLRGNEDANLADDCPACFPAMNAEYWRLLDAATTTAERRLAGAYLGRLNYAITEAPLELIAYVVENNRPYSEILTADYDMLTPELNTATGGTAVFPPGASSTSFQPGRIKGYYLRDSAQATQTVPGTSLPRITNTGNLRIDYPHVGVLSSKSFLSRYPTTATNRNRARARWTYYNFLGVDIEALAVRTTDPVALADTNNPTMNNPSCTVCHSVVDPVAGTYQDYDDSGRYRTALNGTDSLDRIYKNTRGGLYRTGDTWYADMRVPGFEGTAATGTNTVRWLAEKIVADRRFATATVRFWWPAVMGSEVLRAPEVTTDADYAARLEAYSAQQAEISTLADKFTQSGLSLKQLLADMVVSNWYRVSARASTTTQTVHGAARDVAHLTDEKLLTPEQLARKTHALTGFNWNAQIDTVTAAPLSGLEGDYNTFYGGIDSFALKIRAREITPLMSNVAATHALESACPVVLGDFIRPDAQRRLFDGLTPWTTPLTEGSATQTLASTSATDFRPLTLAVTLQPGAKKVVMSLLNDSCNYATSPGTCRSAKNLVVGDISIRAPNGQTTTLAGSSGVRGSCAAASGNSLTLYSSCTADYAFTVATAGSYTITANVAALQTASDPVLAGLNVEADVAPASAATAGTTALKNALIKLHSRLLGQTLTASSPELLASYDLLLQTWQERKSGTAFNPSLFQNARTCDWTRDIGFIGTLPYPADPLQANGRYNTTAINTWLGPYAQDPLYMKQSWVVVMVYLLTHYHYLHE